MEHSQIVAMEKMSTVELAKIKAKHIASAQTKGELAAVEHSTLKNMALHDKSFEYLQEVVFKLDQNDYQEFLSFTMALNNIDIAIIKVSK